MVSRIQGIRIEKCLQVNTLPPDTTTIKAHPPRRRTIRLRVAAVARTTAVQLQATAITIPRLPNVPLSPSPIPIQRLCQIQVSYFKIKLK